MRARLAKKIYRREFKYFSIASSQGDSRFNRYMLRAWLKDIKQDNPVKKGITINCALCKEDYALDYGLPILRQVLCAECALKETACRH